MVGEIINAPETNKTLIKNETFEFDQSVCVCMILKNVDKITNDIKKNIELLNLWFKSVFYIFVNANSNDNTHANFKKVSNSILLDTVYDDEATHRNLYFKSFYSSKEKFNVMMIIDPWISMRTTLKLRSFDFMFHDRMLDWDICFANQTYKYYDLENLVLEKNEIPYKKHIPSNSGLIMVKSAFGGFAVYKTSIFKNNLKYISDNYKNFNLQFSNQNLKMFIISDFLIETSPENAHLFL